MGRQLGAAAIVGVVGSVLVVGAAPALAGKRYTPPTVTAAEAVEAPEGLRRDAAALLAAVRAKEVDGAAGFLAPAITVISASLDLAAKRHAEPLEDGTPASRLAMLGQNTGGDGDLPPGADITAFLHKMEFDFIEQSLTDGRPWGRDPMVKGAICSYGAAAYDRGALAKAAKALGVETSSFTAVTAPVVLLAKPEAGAVEVGRLKPGTLYAVDYDAGEPLGWTAFHLPAGGSGFVRSDNWQSDKPYVSGLCFKESDGVWRVVAQAATGL